MPLLQYACIILILIFSANTAMSAPPCFTLTTEYGDNTVYAGNSFAIIVTARDNSGATNTSLTGKFYLAWTSTANDAPNKTASPIIPSDGMRTFTNGIATIPGFVLVNASETPVITVSDPDNLGTGSITINIKPWIGELFDVTTEHQGTETAGVRFGVNLQITDKYGNIDDSLTDSINVSSSWNAKDSPNGSSSQKPGTMIIPFTNGTATFGSFTLLNAKDSPRITVSSTYGFGLAGTSSTITVIPSSPITFKLFTPATFTGTVISGNPFSLGTIMAYDSFGNTATTYVGSKTIIYSGHDNGSYTTNVLFNNGISTTPLQTKLVCAGTTTITITLMASNSTGTITGTSSPIVVIPVSYSHLVIRCSGTKTAGVAFSIQLITLDQNGKPIDYMGTESIVWSWNATPSPNSIPPTLPPNGSYKFNAGSTTIDGFMLTNTAETPIIFAVSSITQGDSPPIFVSPGTVTNFKIIAPTEVTADVPFNITSIIACDTYGNMASTTYTGNKTLTYSGPGTNSAGIFPFCKYTDSVYFEQGICTTLLQTTLTKAETVSLLISDGYLTGISNLIMVMPGSTTRFEVACETPGTKTAGVPFSVILTLKDKYMNTVNNYTGDFPIIWSWTASNSPNNITPTKPMQGDRAFTNGIGTISGFVLTHAGEFPSITAKSDTISGTSQGIAVNPNAAKSFKIDAPATVTAGGSFTLTNITAFDEFGNKAEYQGTMTLTYSGPGDGPIDGKPSYPSSEVNFVSGVSAQKLEMRLVRAEETAIKIEQGNISGYSEKIVIVPAKPGRFVLSTKNNNQEIAGNTFFVMVVAKDVFGNDGSSYTDTHPLTWGWVAPISPIGIPPSRPANGNQAFSKGTATIGGFVLTNATQTSIWVSDGNISGTASIIVSSTEASYFDISLPSPVTINQPFNIKGLVAKDRLGNVAINYSGEKTLNFTGPGIDSFGNKPSYPSTIFFDAGVATQTPTIPLTIILRKKEITSLSLYDGTVRGTVSQIAVIAPEATTIVSPQVIYVNATQTINYQIKNTGDSEIKEILIKIPAGFSYIAIGSPWVSTGQIWSATGSSTGQFVLLTANNPSYYLPMNAALIVPIDVLTQAEEKLPVKWESVVTDKDGGTYTALEAIKGDSEVSITNHTIKWGTSTTMVLPGGTATVMVQIIDQPAGSPRLVSSEVDFKVSDSQSISRIWTDDKGYAYYNVKTDILQGSVTIEVKYGLFTKKFVFQVASPTPEIIFDKNSFSKHGITYAKPSTMFELKPFEGLRQEYRLDSGQWQSFSQPFTIDSPGEHIINYRFIDASGQSGAEYAATVFIGPILSTIATNYPNPFNPLREDTIIEYHLQQIADASIKIYNLFGELVWMKEILAGQGPQQILWNGKNGDGETVGNGSYICRVIIKYPSGDVIMVRRIGVVK